MRKSPRTLGLIAAALVLVACEPTQVHADPSKYFSQDVEMVFTINFKQILDSPLVTKNKELVTILKTMMETQIRQSDEAVKIQKALDFDPFKDLHSITYAGPAGKDQSKALVIASGNFKLKNFADAGDQAARQHPDKVKAHRVANSNVYQMTPPGEKEFFIGLADKNTLLVSQTMDGMRKALNARQGNVNKDLKTLLDKTNAKQSVSFVMTKSALQKAIKDNDNPQIQAAGPIVEKIEGVAAIIDVKKDVEFRVSVDAKNAQAAQELSKQTSQGFLMLSLLVQQQAQQNPQMAPLVDIVNTLRASSQGATMTMNGRVPAEVIQQGIDVLKAFSP